MMENSDFTLESEESCSKVAKAFCDEMGIAVDELVDGLETLNHNYTKSACGEPPTIKDYIEDVELIRVMLHVLKN